MWRKVFVSFVFVLWSLTCVLAQNKAKTFKVISVEKADTLLEEIPYHKAVKYFIENASQDSVIDPKNPNQVKSIDSLRIIGFPLGDSSKTLVKGIYAHPFISALHLAFAEHRPLVISPDMIWLIVTQGIAMHIHENSDSLQQYLVDFEGKKQIEILRDTFRLYQNNDWKGVIAELSDSVKIHTDKKLYDTFVHKFSTSSEKEITAFQACLLDAYEPYFKYGLGTYCGIPEIRLEGTKKDWQWIYNQCDELDQFGLEKWKNELKPVLKEFVNVYENKIDTNFWQSFYRLYESCGEYSTGWVVKFFPYLYDKLSNEIIPNTSIYQKGEFGSIENEWYPSGLSTVDIEWYYYGDTINMELYSGFIGISQDKKTKALRPEISWFIKEKHRDFVKRCEKYLGDLDIKSKRRKNDPIGHSRVDDLNFWMIHFPPILDFSKKFDEDSIFISLKEMYRLPNFFPKKYKDEVESLKALPKYIRSKLPKKRPKYTADISFTATWNRKLTDISIYNSSNPELDAKIIEILSKIENFTPAGVYKKYTTSLDLTLYNVEI